ncbi:MAG: DNA replication and repair protein RecF [Litorivivens sp.]
MKKPDLILNQISLVNFKNYDDAGIKLCSSVNCFLGDNGSGKTNVLDAIYYLSMCKSYFNPIDSQNVKRNTAFFSISGVFEKNSDEHKIHCAVKPGQKKVFKRNGKDYDRLADHIGLFPVVIISPVDADLITEGSEVRRKFIDGIISQYNRSYLNGIIAYNRVLLQRNNLLKHFAAERKFDADSLAIWTDQLVEYGAPLYEIRKDFIREFKPLVEQIYSEVSGGAESASLEYKSMLSESSFEDLLSQALSADQRAQRSTKGIHKDDLDFSINGFPVKKFGSQGQQKSFLIALKLAQFEYIKKSTGVTPILLLDDIFDKIDDKRVAHLMKLVSQHKFGQTFVTDTHARRVPELFAKIDNDVKVFNVKGGIIETANSLDS